MLDTGRANPGALKTRRRRVSSFQGGPSPMSSDPGDPDDESAALRARLDRLKGDLKGRAPPRPSGSAMSRGLRAGSEFVSAVILGLGIGWVLDRVLHTNPAFLIVFFLIGFAAGIWSVIRLTSPKRSP